MHQMRESKSDNPTRRANALNEWVANRPDSVKKRTVNAIDAYVIRAYTQIPHAFGVPRLQSMLEVGGC